MTEKIHCDRCHDDIPMPNRCTDRACPLNPKVVAGVLITPINSRYFAKVGYDPAGQLFACEFRNGKPGRQFWTYGNVTPELHAEMMMADSVGSFFIHNIRNDPKAYPPNPIAIDEPDEPEEDEDGRKDERPD